MKQFKKYIATILALTSINALADFPIRIDSASPLSITADQWNPPEGDELVIRGSGFFPQSIFQAVDITLDVQKAVQVVYRQVYPSYGPTLVAPYYPTNNNRYVVYVDHIGPEYISLGVHELTKLDKANTAWSFSVCAYGVGCSNSVTLNIKSKTPPDVVVATGTNPIDVVAGSSDKPILLEVTGLTNSSPILRMGPAGSIWGNLDGRQARFLVPASALATPNYILTKIEDSITGAASEAFPIRVFGKPEPRNTDALSVVENLASADPIKDAQLVIPMAQMTFPTTAEWIDGSNVTRISVPLDLLTNKAKINIPTSSLRVGKYTVNLRLTNIAGEKIVPVNVEINKTVVTPIPRPIPIPDPVPRPTPIPTPIPRPIPIPPRP